jgi:ribose transport system permease protein
MKTHRQRLLLPVLNHATLILFVVVLAVFGLLSPRFFTSANLANLLVQASSTVIVGVGMTFVLLTAGVDLSVGSIMFVGAAVAGKLVLGGASMPVALLAIAAVGLGCGALNALLITRLGILAFIATLGTLFVGRGFGLWVTQTRAMNLPEEFLALGTTRMAGVPLPVLIAAAVVVIAHLVLTQTPFGRQVHAVGNNTEAARKAGLDTRRILTLVYMGSGLCAALGGMLSLAQLGAVSPTFGTNREFAAIAAAVLGGTSLFGGRGAVFPGTVLGAVLIQSVENGLVILNADPYLYPLVTSGIIFLAVLLDSTRSRLLAHWNRRRIYLDERG